MAVGGVLTGTDGDDGAAAGTGSVVAFGVGAGSGAGLDSGVGTVAGAGVSVGAETSDGAGDGDEVDAGAVVSTGWFDVDGVLLVDSDAGAGELSCGPLGCVSIMLMIVHEI